MRARLAVRHPRVTRAIWKAKLKRTQQMIVCRDTTVAYMHENRLTWWAKPRSFIIDWQMGTDCVQVHPHVYVPLSVLSPVLVRLLKATAVMQ